MSERIERVDFSFAEEFGKGRHLRPGEPTNLSFVAPFPIRVDAVIPATDCVLERIFYGSQVLFPCAIRASDFPEMTVPVDEVIRTGVSLTIQVTGEGFLDGRIVCRRISPKLPDEGENIRALPRQRVSLTAASIGDAETISPGEVRIYKAYPQTILRGDVVAVDNPDGLVLERAEVGRDPQIDAPVALSRRTSIRLRTAKPAEEIRFFIRNQASSPKPFTARIFGAAVPNA